MMTPLNPRRVRSPEAQMSSQRDPQALTSSQALNLQRLARSCTDTLSVLASRSRTRWCDVSQRATMVT